MHVFGSIPCAVLMASPAECITALVFFLESTVSTRELLEDYTNVNCFLQRSATVSGTPQPCDPFELKISLILFLTGAFGKGRQPPPRGALARGRGLLRCLPDVAKRRTSFEKQLLAYYWVLVRTKHLSVLKYP